MSEVVFLGVSAVLEKGTGSVSVRATEVASMPVAENETEVTSVTEGQGSVTVSVTGTRTGTERVAEVTSMTGVEVAVVEDSEIVTSVPSVTEAEMVVVGPVATTVDIPGMMRSVVPLEGRIPVVTQGGAWGPQLISVTTLVAVAVTAKRGQQWQPKPGFVASELTDVTVNAPGNDARQMINFQGMVSISVPQMDEADKRP